MRRYAAMPLASILLILLARITPACALQTGVRSLPAIRATASIVIDGRLEDAAWRQAVIAREFIDPFTGSTAQEQTEAYLLYDDQAVYVAFYCHDTHPERIVAREIRYGAEFVGEDTVTFYIDPFYRRSWDTTSRFTVNALGTQNEQISAGRAAKREWRGVWQAATARVPDGWIVEMRLPWEILNFPDSDRPITIGINFSRYQARTHIRTYWSDVTPAERPERIGIWQGVQLPRRPRRDLFQALLYASPEWEEEGDRQRFRAGIDLRYTPSPQMTGVATIFPDFRNIEQAIEGIEFSRSERFVEETRPFFLEGASYFPSLFYSRRVVNFDVGAKAFGNIRPQLTFGVLSLFQTQRDNVSAGRLSYSLAEHGQINLSGTLRRGRDPEHEAFGVDGYLRSGNWRMGGEWSHAREGSDGGVTGTFGLSYNVPRFNALLNYTSIDPGYRASLGFVPFTDQRGVSLVLSHDNEFRHGPFRSISAGVGVQRLTHFNGDIFQEGGAARLMLFTRNDCVLGIGPEIMRFNRTHDRVLNTALGGNVSNRYRRWSLGYSFGMRADHAIRFFNFGFTQRVFGRMDLGFNGSILRHVESREQYILTVGWEFDARRALNARLVQRDGQINWYLSYRNSGGLGQEIYFILGDPNAPRFTGRLALKWVQAL